MTRTVVRFDGIDGDRVGLVILFWSVYITNLSSQEKKLSTRNTAESSCRIRRWSIVFAVPTIRECWYESKQRVARSARVCVCTHMTHDTHLHDVLRTSQALSNHFVRYGTCFRWAVGISCTQSTIGSNTGEVVCLAAKQTTLCPRKDYEDHYQSRAGR